MTRIQIAAALILTATPALAEAPPPCPAAGGIVERSVGPATVYLGSDPADPALCRIRRGTDTGTFWFGAWNTAWPGADAARAGFASIWNGPTGATAKFDVSAGPGLQWHETLRNEGPETLRVLDHSYRTIRYSHEREGFDGNTYHSIITQWRDIETGLSIYQNYQHISGHPEPGGSWDPVAITAGR